MQQIADIIGRVTAHSAGPDLVLVAISSMAAAVIAQAEEWRQDAERSVARSKRILAAPCRRLDQARRDCRGKTIQILAALKRCAKRAPATEHLERSSGTSISMAVP